MHGVQHLEKDLNSIELNPDFLSLPLILHIQSNSFKIDRKEHPCSRHLL